jgi:hypothetical protein
MKKALQQAREFAIVYLSVFICLGLGWVIGFDTMSGLSLWLTVGVLIDRHINKKSYEQDIDERW